MNKEAWRKKIKERIDSGIKGNHITAPEGMDLHKYGFVKVGKGKRAGTVRWSRGEYERARKRENYNKNKEK